MINLWLLMVLFTVSSCKAKQENNAESIFNDVKDSIVELKANTGDLISYGSAVLIKKDGTFISNAHLLRYKSAGVYKDFENIEIRFNFETKYRKVNVIKHDEKLDASVLKLESLPDFSLNAINIGDSSLIKTGEKVYAVGNGLNHGISISEGIVSLSKVDIIYDNYSRELIQCDIQINEGNSGGALVDNESKLIGITTLRLKDDLGQVIYGMAYCLPINIVIDYFK